MIVVYGLKVGNISDKVEVICRVFNEKELTEALEYCQELRDQRCINVVLSSEPSGMVGGFGVDSVEDGKTPDGQEYEWSKQHRGGPPQKG